MADVTSNNLKLFCRFLKKRKILFLARKFLKSFPPQFLPTATRSANEKLTYSTCHLAWWLT